MDDGARRHGTSAGVLDGAVPEDVGVSLRRRVTAHGRDDLLVRLDEVMWRADRAETLVCVVGEFKKGKSALVNAILGETACPVDDDLATAAVTVVRHDRAPSLTVRRRSDGGVVTEAAGPGEVTRWVVEREDRGRPDDVVLAEVGLRHDLLERGIALVDTPGVGGLDAAHAVATLAFLPIADVIVFVTDASAELTRSELAFLSRAVQAGPPVLVVVTKIDMYPDWRRIVTLDRDHLRAAGMHLEPCAVSSVLGEVARRGDGTLSDASGVPALTQLLLEAVGQAADRPGRAGGAAAAAEVAAIIDLVREPLAIELAAIEHPEHARGIVRRLDDVRDRLAELSAADSHWASQLDAGFEDLRGRVGFTFQAGLRQCLRDARDEVDRVDPAGSWPELGGRFQASVAAVVRDAFMAVTDGATRVAAGISDALSDTEALPKAADAASGRFDVASLWVAQPGLGSRCPAGPLGQVGAYAGATLFAASLGTVGLEMVGLLGSLLGAAIVGPAVVGVALARGGKQIVDARHRALADRRRDAGAFLADFIDDVRFEVDGRLVALLGDLQQQLRSHYARRIRELRLTNEHAMQSLERTEMQEHECRRARIETLRAEIGELEALVARVTGGNPGGASDPPRDRPVPSSYEAADVREAPGVRPPPPRAGPRPGRSRGRASRPRRGRPGT